MKGSLPLPFDMHAVSSSLPLEERDAYNDMIHRKHYAQVWPQIFENSEWTDIIIAEGGHPVLLGQGIENMLSGSNDVRDVANIALAVLTKNTDTRDTTFPLHLDLLLSSLRGKTLDKITLEVVDNNTNLRLNIDQILIGTLLQRDLLMSEGRFMRVMFYDIEQKLKYAKVNNLRDEAPLALVCLDGFSSIFLSNNTEMDKFARLGILTEVLNMKYPAWEHMHEQHQRYKN